MLFHLYTLAALFNGTKMDQRKAKQAELLQLLLLDSIYASSGSESLIFQNGTALRWIYGGSRFSEDLDFVTGLPLDGVKSILEKLHIGATRACIAQFGPGVAEQKVKKARKQAHKVFFVFRPDAQRERIAVKLEFETLKQGEAPEFKQYIFRDLPQVSGLIMGGQLILPYTSSIIIAETPAEILSDKIRALYERRYIKGRDIYDIWWLVTQLKTSPDWSITKKNYRCTQLISFPPGKRAIFSKKPKPAKSAMPLKRTCRDLSPGRFSISIVKINLLPFWRWSNT